MTKFRNLTPDILVLISQKLRNEKLLNFLLVCEETIEISKQLKDKSYELEGCNDVFEYMQEYNISTEKTHETIKFYFRRLFLMLKACDIQSLTLFSASFGQYTWDVISKYMPQNLVKLELGIKDKTRIRPLNSEYELYMYSYDALPRTIEELYLCEGYWNYNPTSGNWYGSLSRFTNLRILGLDIHAKIFFTKEDIPNVKIIKFARIIYSDIMMPEHNGHNLILNMTKFIPENIEEVDMSQVQEIGNCFVRGYGTKIDVFNTIILQANVKYLYLHQQSVTNNNLSISPILQTLEHIALGPYHLTSSLPRSLKYMMIYDSMDQPEKTPTGITILEVLCTFPEEDAEDEDENEEKELYTDHQFIVLGPPWLDIIDENRLVRNRMKDKNIKVIISNCKKRRILYRDIDDKLTLNSFFKNQFHIIYPFYYHRNKKLLETLD